MKLNNIFTLIYLLITLTYGNHFINKSNYDFQIIAFLYLCLTCVYYKEYIEEDTDIDKNHKKHKNMIKMLSIMYGIIFLIYIKHLYKKDDFDYIYLASITLIIGII